MLKRELEKIDNEERREKDREFFKNYFGAHTKFCYSGVNGTRFLDAYRKKKKDPTIKLLSLPTIIFDKTKTITNVVDAEFASKIYSFLEEQNVSLTTLFSFAYRTYLSAVNNRAEEIFFEDILDHRSTLAERNCGGNRATGAFLITNFPESTSFKEALAETSKTLMQIYAHIELPHFEVDAIMREVVNVANPAEQPSAMIISCMPPVPFPEELKEWNPDFKGFSNGHFPMLDYTIIVPDERTGEITFHYEYNVHYLSEEIIGKMHNYILKAIEMGINDPNVTIGEIMDTL